jgi:hypothetical protein
MKKIPFNYKQLKQIETDLVFINKYIQALLVPTSKSYANNHKLIKRILNVHIKINSLIDLVDEVNQQQHPNVVHSTDSFAITKNSFFYGDISYVIKSPKTFLTESKEIK